MTDKLTTAISAALKGEFGAIMTAYGEYAPQGAKAPCVFISCDKPDVKAFPGGRYLNRFPFRLKYFPSDKLNPGAECHRVGERLFRCLEIISEGGDKLRGSEMRYEFDDGIMTFFVCYKFFTRRAEDSEKFGEMALTVDAPADKQRV